MRELYLAPFEDIVQEARPWAVMAAYNGVNGHTMTESPLLREILKDEWEWDGLVMSDWTATRSLDAARAALDLAMPGPGGPWGDALVAAAQAGEVDEAAIDDKVLRILRLAARAGALDGVEPAGGTPGAWPAGPFVHNGDPGCPGSVTSCPIWLLDDLPREGGCRPFVLSLLSGADGLPSCCRWRHGSAGGHLFTWAPLRVFWWPPACWALCYRS